MDALNPDRRTTEMKRNKIVIIFLAILLTSGFVLASDAWLHVKVDSASGEGETVEVNIPFSLVQAILPLVDVDPLKNGKLHFDDLDVEGVELGDLDLRAVLEEFRRTGDTEFVRVRDGQENVTVSKKGDFLLINVDSEGDGEKVRVRFPLEIIDAMLESGSEGLDLIAALNVLSDFEGDLVSVEDGDEIVRVWIDHSNSMN
jgi:hypothetical protein